MGSFDEVHTGHRCGQTKALGKGMRALTPGDRVVLQPAVMTGEQALEHGCSTMPEQPLVTDFDAVMDVGYLHVRDARIGSWDDEQDLRVPLVDYHGWSVVERDELEGRDRDLARPGGCQVCAQVRARTASVRAVR